MVATTNALVLGKSRRHGRRDHAAVLRKNGTPVVITDQHLPVGTWRDVLHVMELLPDPPLVIVISTHADDRLWAEALNLGAHDVLAKPLDRQETIRVLQCAWHHWAGRRQRKGPDSN